MYTLISLQTAKETINEAEKSLSKCFDMLIDIKNGTNLIKDALLNFQPLLADCLYELMAFYQKLHTEKDYIISQKNTWSSEYFKTTIATNAKLRDVVKETISIGKTLGDAFAWFFYTNNRPELDMHFEHPSTGLFVAGVGGRGEIEFIKHNQILDGLFVVYHGITDMLRIGDFSLYLNHGGIVGVGELKSQSEGNRINVSAHITSKIDVRKGEKTGNSGLSFDESVKQLQRVFPSLPKQLKIQDQLMQAKKDDHTTNFLADYEYDVVNRLSPQFPLVLNADHSLLLCAAWSERHSLFEVLFEDEQVAPPVELSTYALELMKPASQFNEAVISEIDTKMFFTRIPIFWWKIGDELCRDIYFRRVAISTVFNPAKLLSRFTDKGFRVLGTGKLDEIKIEKNTDGKRLEFGNLQMYMDLIQHSMMRTDTVFAIAERLINCFEISELPSNSKVDIHIHQHNFGRMPKE